MTCNALFLIRDITRSLIRTNVKTHYYCRQALCKLYTALDELKP